MARPTTHPLVFVSACFTLLMALTVVGAVAAEPGAGAAGAGGSVDFVLDVQPIFAQHCYQCHDGSSRKGGFQLDVKSRALAGGDSGPAVVPGDPVNSKLIHLVSGHDPKEIMPPKGKGQPLTARQVDVLARWIKQGAAWPDGVDKAADAKPQAKHWAFQKPVRPDVPPVTRKDWARNPVDHFILARLEKEGLAPSPEADRHALIRRVSLDLTGLPPTPQEVKAFVEDKSPDAYEKLVDRLLASPAYGERWARMWMDLARYADSSGHGSDLLRTIWLYRDWVIEAFNRNLPYDRFTVEQLAGDLLPNPTQDQLVATAFHRNTMTNVEGGTDDEEFRVVAVKDRANVTAQVWSGLTMGCAQCHTHKYDPITQREYYSFYAFFNQTEDADRNDEAPLLEVWTKERDAQREPLRAKVAELEARLKQDTPELAAGRDRWAQEALAKWDQWVVLEPKTFTSAGGATIAEQPDRSLLVSGTRPETDTVTVTADTHLANITAVKIEALPDPSLPGGGPGRADGGDFVLSDVRLTVSPARPGPLPARHVRVELPGRQRILSLAEVQVFSGGENVAAGGKATQSSSAFGGDAPRAVDGNTDGDFETAHSTTHTELSDDPWWEVDLGRTAAVERVVVWNRNSSQQRLANARVVLLDENRKVLWEGVVAEPPAPQAALGVTGAQAVPLRNASDTGHAAGEAWAAGKAIDGHAGAGSGWSQGAGHPEPHAAVFETGRPVGASRGATLTFTLKHATPRASLGKFRLSVTTAPPPLRALPASVARVLAVPPHERTPEHVAQLTGFYRTFSPELQTLREQVAQATEQLEAIKPVTVPVMRELPSDKRRVTNVMIKGNFLARGEEVKPGFPAAFHEPPKDAPNNRLGVALWLVSPDNPLTARVHANRLWAQLFGTGLVETQEDFGIMGQPPSHPQLLDWLATEFQHTLKWDQKGFLKLLVTSAAYRQSSVLRPEVKEKDPLDRLIARYPRRRVEAEIVRDQALSLAGLLSKKMYGPSVFPPQPEGLWQVAFNGERTWTTSTGEDRYRRGIYVFWRRTVPYPSMAAFDAPSREVCTVRRVHSNTPLQAFVTLNDPVYVEAAQALARRILKEGGKTPAERAKWGLELVQGRPASDEQVKHLLELCKAETEHYNADPQAAKQVATDPLGPLPDGMDTTEAAAWTVVANVLLNLDAVLTKG